MEKFLIIFDVRKKESLFFFFRDDKRRSAVNLKQGKDKGLDSTLVVS